jgi:hypothetical protein
LEDEEVNFSPSDFLPGFRYHADMSAFSRKQIQALLLCYTVFLLYATLWPFDFHFAQGIATPHKISWIPFFDPVGGPGRRDASERVKDFETLPVRI